MRVIYIPLESYNERYTLQLREWTEREFERLGISYLTIDGVALGDGKIRTGQVLDVHSRCYWALAQVQTLVHMLYKYELNDKDFILFEDMFHPGIESLAYIFAQQFNGTRAKRPKVGVKCLAQTLDPDDFVYYCGMANWMRNYEKMVNSFVDVVFMASEEMVAHATIAGWKVPCVVTGLSFGKAEVLERLKEDVKPFSVKAKRVVFASRMTKEKQPEFFLSLAKQYKERYPKVEFAIASGSKIKYPGVDQAVLMGDISVYSDLSKQQYYQLLNDSRVVFLSSLQDWVSNIISEADTMGCNVVVPAYRSFPEALANNENSMYIPWSLASAYEKVFAKLQYGNSCIGEISDYQDKSIERTVLAMQKIVEHGYAHMADNPQDTRYRARITTTALKGDI